MGRSLLAVILLWSGWAHAHGGPPVTHEILVGSGNLDLVTTHGFFSEDTGWMWVCEEASGADLATRSIRTPDRWLVGTLDGVFSSQDGCDWTYDPALEGQFIYALVQDSQKPGRTWAATEKGIWRIDGLEDAVLDTPVDFSLRHLGQRSDGTMILLGFEGPTPIAQIGDIQVELPVKTGRLEVLTFDAQGRFYLHFPAGKTDRLVRVSEEGAEVLIDQTELIRDVAAIGPELYVLYDKGTSWSYDDGTSWTPPDGEPIRCLIQQSANFYACPTEGGGPAFFMASDLDADPTNWTWEVALRFDEVTPNTCEPGTTAGNQCPYLWHLAGVELGVLEPPSEDPTGPETASCSGAKHTPSHWTIILVMGVLFVRRKQRSVPR